MLWYKKLLSVCRFSHSENTSRGGFSLPELLTALAVIAIMSAFAVPSYISTIPQRRLKAAARELYSAMQQARLLAVKNNLPVRVCFESASNSYYFDIFDSGDISHNEQKCDSVTKRIDLSKYNDVEFGSGAAQKKWDYKKIAQASYITFSPTGTANSKTVYLQNIGAPSESFAVTSQTSGSLKIRRSVK